MDNEPAVTSAFHTPGPWPPRTEAALETAAKNRDLVESHYLELKQELPPNSDPANKELARDLASLAIDGGLLILGVDEVQNYALTPVPLDGLAERVEQVAGSRIDEPLPLTFIEIESAANPAGGYLLVRVPASPRAPHMVDNRYWGRGDKTAHLFVVADPVPPRERLLLPVLGVGDWTTAFRALVAATTHQGGGTFSPDLPNSLSNFSTTADGWAWKSHAVFGQRDEGEQGLEREKGALIVEICENGQLRMMCGRATEDYNGKRLMFDDLVLGLTARMVSLAAAVSHATGFLGSWDIGVGITMLKSAISNRRYSRDGFGLPGPPYTADSYSASTRAALAEIEGGTGPIVERVLGRLYRAVGADQVAEVQKHFT